MTWLKAWWFVLVAVAAFGCTADRMERRPVTLAEKCATDPSLPMCRFNR